MTRPSVPRPVETAFLERTARRALTSRAEARVSHLRELERLIYRGEFGLGLGVQGHLLASMARRFPVSTRAMQLEFRDGRLASIVEVAELIELDLPGGPPAWRVHGRSRGDDRP